MEGIRMSNAKEKEPYLPATVELATQPAMATENGLNAVTYLMKLLDKKQHKVMINGKRHIEFDDWIILGNYYGITVKSEDAEPVEVFGVKGAKARASVIRIEDGVNIGGAVAYCMGDERNWRGKPWFQIASMAQTRAGSKALANVLRGFVALKGISGTPAEEMTGNEKPVRTTKPAPAKKMKVRKTPAGGKKPAPAPKSEMPESEKVVDGEITVKDTINPDEVFMDCSPGLIVADILRDNEIPLTRENINKKAVGLMPEKFTTDDIKDINTAMDKAGL